MKKALAVLLALTLLLAALPVQAELDVDSPYAEAAYRMTLIQFGTLHGMLDTQEEIWDYTLSVGPQDCGDSISYATHDARFEAVFRCNPRRTGVEAVRVVFSPSLLTEDSIYDVYLMSFSLVGMQLVFSDDEAARDRFADTLLNQLAEVAVNAGEASPYQTEPVEIVDGLYLSCCRDGDSCAVLFEFGTPATTDSLSLYLHAAMTMIPQE